MRIDRFEGEKAIIELTPDSFFELPRIALPDFAAEGDFVVLTVNKSATMEKKAALKARLGSLFQKE